MRALIFPLLVAASFAMALAPAPATARSLTLTTPPRESAEKAAAIMHPIAEHLTQALGTPVTFEYADNWLTYQSRMQKNEFDIVFDGPHFVSWRMSKLGHTPVVELPGELQYVVVTRKENAVVSDLTDIPGRALCSPAPPNLGALIALYEFSNPVRQPILRNTKGFPQAFEGLLQGKCVAAVIQAKQYEKLDKDLKAGRVVFKSKGLPNQAISASPRLSTEQVVRMQQALMSDAGKQATRLLREEYNGQDFVSATEDEYRGHSILLKDSWGFSQ